MTLAASIARGAGFSAPLARPALGWQGSSWRSRGVQTRAKKVEQETTPIPPPAAEQQAPAERVGIANGAGQALFATVLILAVIGAFYALVAVSSQALVSQFQTEIGSVMKKDFVPYSERLALERAVLSQREAPAADAPAADKPVDEGPPGKVLSEKELLSLLPGSAE